MSEKAHFFIGVISVGALVFIVGLMRKRQLRAKYSFLWLSVGIGLIVLAVFPRLLDRVSAWVGISYPPTTFFIVAIALLLLVVVHFSWELSRLEERTRTLAEQLALSRVTTPGDVRAEDAGTVPDN